jgi:hypothetical protein
MFTLHREQLFLCYFDIPDAEPMIQVLGDPELGYSGLFFLPDLRGR